VAMKWLMASQREMEATMKMMQEEKEATMEE
jgi:hypothetical protein